VWLNSAWKCDKASALFPAVGGQFGQSPNLRSRVSELHPDMPQVSTSKSRSCFLVWGI